MVRPPVTLYMHKTVLVTKLCFVTPRLRSSASRLRPKVGHKSRLCDYAKRSFARTGVTKQSLKTRKLEALFQRSVDLVMASAPRDSYFIREIDRTRKPLDAA